MSQRESELMGKLSHLRSKNPEDEASWVCGVLDSIECLHLMYDRLPQEDSARKQLIKDCVRLMSKMAGIFTPEWVMPVVMRGPVESS